MIQSLIHIQNLNLSNYCVSQTSLCFFTNLVDISSIFPIAQIQHVWMNSSVTSSSDWLLFLGLWFLFMPIIFSFTWSSNLRVTLDSYLFSNPCPTRHSPANSLCVMSLVFLSSYLTAIVSGKALFTSYHNCCHCCLLHLPKFRPSPEIQIYPTLF